MLKSRTYQADLNITIYDAIVLLYHVHLGAQLPDICGFEDNDNTLKKLVESFTRRRIVVPKVTIESALWSANMMDENDSFWAPNDESFDAFVKTMLLKCGLPNAKFDRVYNRISYQVDTQPAAAPAKHDFED